MATTEITSWTAGAGTRALGERGGSSGPGQGRGGENGVASHDLSFGDFLDIINPLQHIPIVGTVYRALVGDEISGVARVMGDFLYGGPLGLLTGIASAAIEESTGSDLGEHAMAWLTGEDAGSDVGPDPVAVAALAPEAVAPAASVGGNDAALAALAADLQAGAIVATSATSSATATLPIDVKAAPTSVDAVAQYQNVLQTMNAALDRYDALKAAEAKKHPSY